MDRHKTTGPYGAAIPPQRQKSIGAKWVSTYTTDKDGLIVKTKAKLVPEGLSQVHINYFQKFAPTPSSASAKIMAADANTHGFKISHVAVAHAFVCAKLDADIYMKLPSGCGDMSGTLVRPKISLCSLQQSGRRWVGLLAGNVEEYGMEQYRSDPCVFPMSVVRKAELIKAVPCG